MTNVNLTNVPTPADDLPGEPVEPEDLRAGDRIAFTWMGERITGTLASDHDGALLRADAPGSDGHTPNVVYKGRWWYDDITDVRLIERAPREGEHTPDAEWTCTLCGDVDTAGLRAEVDRLRAGIEEARDALAASSCMGGRCAGPGCYGCRDSTLAGNLGALLNPTEGETDDR